MRALAPLFVLILLGCTATEEVFTGTLTPAGGTCDPASRATLTIRHEAVLFTPTSGVLTLTGAREAGGRITASLTRPGLAHTSITQHLTAQQTGAAIQGEYTTQRCRYRVALHAAG